MEPSSPGQTVTDWNEVARIFKSPSPLKASDAVLYYEVWLPGDTSDESIYAELNARLRDIVEFLDGLDLHRLEM